MTTLMLPTVLLLVWFVALALLAPRFGADTRDRCDWQGCHQ